MEGEETGLGESKKNLSHLDRKKGVASEVRGKGEIEVLQEPRKASSK